MSRIKLPNTALGSFIRAANSWLSRTIDAKSGLEVRFANHDGKLHVSVGADACYIEALLIVDPADIQHLTQPIWLDVPSLASYHFKHEDLKMVVPQVEKEDQRIQFVTPGFNFRIPRKKGEIWRRNFFQLGEVAIQGLVLGKDEFKLLQDNMKLPNSFKTERSDFQVCIDVKPGVGFDVFGYDVGAFWHQFKNPAQVGTPGLMVFVEDFFVPCKEFDVQDKIGFSVSDTQCYGEFRSPEAGIELLRWTKPKFQKRPSDVPKAIDIQRQVQVSRFITKPKQLAAHVDQACMFLTPTEMRSVPLALSIVGNQYSMTTKKPSGEGEVTAEGSLDEAASSNVDINLQPACMKDYMGQFESNEPVAVEVLKRTILMHQETEKFSLIYWMPRLPGVGAEA